jgi:hypothetical protein
MTDPAFDFPLKGPSIPTALTADIRIRFRCYKGISCFNAELEQDDEALLSVDRATGVPGQGQRP